MNKPISISPAPLVEAYAEFKFEPTGISSELLLSKLYAKLQDVLPETEKTSAFNIPDEIRNQRPEFQYAADYRLVGDEYLVALGNNVIGISSGNDKGQYEHWEKFLGMITKVLNTFKDTVGIESFISAELRYINAFSGSVKETLSLKLELGNIEVDDKDKFTINIAREVDGLDTAITLGNGASIEGRNFTHEGTVLSTVVTSNEILPFEDTSSVLEKLHSKAEDIFFSSLNNEYLETLNPTYE